MKLALVFLSSKLRLRNSRMKSIKSRKPKTTNKPPKNPFRRVSTRSTKSETSSEKTSKSLEHKKINKGKNTTKSSPNMRSSKSLLRKSNG